MNKLEEIFQRLDLNTSKGLYLITDKIWKDKLQFPSRIKRILEKKISPNAFFCMDNKPLILFFYNRKDKETLHKAIWNFNESPIAIFIDNDKVEIFNGFKYDLNKNYLELIGGEDKLDNFIYFELVTGKTWEKYQENLSYDNRLDHYLLKNIKSTRDILIKRIKVDSKVANALIGKCIFVRYLIDRKVNINITPENHLKEWSNDGFCEILKNKVYTQDFFNYLKKKFNGDDVFAISNEEFDNIPDDALPILIRLLQSEDLEKGGQRSLFDLYNFSIIPIEFISNVYELFIGKENQKDDGAYYTPLFLVDYILNETIVQKFEEDSKSTTCITLDPACGSGVFLVETLRKIIEQYQLNNPNEELSHNILRKFASENIYGIDKDPSAVQVAIFSVYLTLLDYQSPADIEKFKFPPLLNTNFFEADSFNTKATFNDNLKSINFDYIIGNPPWEGTGLDKLGQEYIKDRRKKEKSENKKYQIAINNGEIAEAFVLRVSDFSNSKTKFALIVRSSILYNLGYKTPYSDFRRYWLEEFYINKIIELAPVRKEVFDKSNDKAIAPAAILFYSYANGESTDSNILEHITIKPTLFFSYFKILTINRTDIKKIEQKLLKTYDWLFKTLVYGSYLDFNLIKRLNEDFVSVKKLISDKSKFIYGTGIHCRKDTLLTSKNTDSIKNIDLISSYAIEPYFINYNQKGAIDYDKIDIIKDTRLYKAPMLLIRKGLDTIDLTAKGAVSMKDVIFKDAITSIKSFNGDVNTLKIILGLVSSNLYSYLSINTFASIGIEREQTQNYNKFSIPFVDCDIVLLVEQIEKLKYDLHQEKNQIPVNNIKCTTFQNQINKTQQEIEKKIIHKLNFDAIENSLLDYALTINKPLITRTEKNKYETIRALYKPLSFKSEYLSDYVNIFLNRFKPNIDNSKHKFIARIWHTNQIIGIFFEVVSIETIDENGIIWEKADNKKLLPKIVALGSEKITDKLFVQKDIRGFDKDIFYIFKPNEKRLWHKAIGFIDVAEFMDAILKAGRMGK